MIQIITALERGGAQRLALETAVRLHRQNRPSYLITGAPPAALHLEAQTRLGRRHLIEPNLVGPLALSADLAALLSLGKTLATLQKQHGRLIVHTHSSKAGMLGRLAARSVTGTRVVHTVHGFGIDALGARARPFLIAGEQLASAATDLLLLTTEGDLARCSELRLSKRPRKVLFPEACDHASYRDLARRGAEKWAARKRLGISGRGPLAITLGNLKKQKDPLFHVDILAAWRKKEPDAQLLFFGDGPLRRATEGLRTERNLQNAFHLPGFCTDPTDALLAADVMLLASRWEGLPLSVLEGLSAGLPVVVRDSGWAPTIDFCPQRFTALNFDQGAADYAAPLARAAALPRAAVELPSRFTWEGALASLDALYDELEFA